LDDCADADRAEGDRDDDDCAGLDGAFPKRRFLRACRSRRAWRKPRFLGTRWPWASASGPTVFGTRASLLIGAFNTRAGAGTSGASVSFGAVAADFSLAISNRVRLRQSPGGTSSASGPYCTRRIFSTWCPTSSNIFRTWRLRPSMIVTSSQRVIAFADQANSCRRGAHTAAALFRRWRLRSEAYPAYPRRAVRRPSPHRSLARWTTPSSVHWPARHRWSSESSFASPIEDVPRDRRGLHLLHQNPSRRALLLVAHRGHVPFRLVKPRRK